MEKKGNLIFPPVEEVQKDSEKNNGRNNGNDCDKKDNNDNNDDNRKTRNGVETPRGGWTRW